MAGHVDIIRSHKYSYIAFLPCLLVSAHQYNFLFMEALLLSKNNMYFRNTLDYESCLNEQPERMLCKQRTDDDLPSSLTLS